MKFTEGFWEKSEAAHACYAVQAYRLTYSISTAFG